MTNDLEKEIELAEDLKGKLDQIEGKKPARKARKKVSQEVKSPADADRNANVGALDEMKHKLETLEKPVPVITDIPDPTKHKYISFVKSGVRILAGVALIMVPMEFWTTVAGALLIVAEVLGIAEEMV